MVTHYTQMFMRKMLGLSFMDSMYSSRAQTRPSSTSSYQKPGSTDYPSNSSSLPLSMSSCSNKPDHPSDAAEDHSRGQDSCYSATTLSSFFCSPSDTQSPFFSSPLASSRSFLQSSNAIPFFPLHPQLRRLHESSSINANRHAQSCTHHTA